MLEAIEPFRRPFVVLPVSRWGVFSLLQLLSSMGPKIPPLTLK